MNNQDKNFSAEWQKRIDEALEGQPEFFGLKAFPGKTFRVSHRSSYVNDSGDLQLHTQVQSGDKWLDFAKCYPAELYDAIVPLPVIVAAYAKVDMSLAAREERLGALIGVGTAPQAEETGSVCLAGNPTPGGDVCGEPDCICAPKIDEHEQRQEIERKIAKKTIAAMLEAGYSLGVFDGEEIALRRCTDPEKVFEAMFSTDDDHLLVYQGGDKGKKIGWVRFIYGNDGYDVINDYTTNLESQMQNVNDYAESLDPH